MNCKLSIDFFIAITLKQGFSKVCLSSKRATGEPREYNFKLILELMMKSKQKKFLYVFNGSFLRNVVVRGHSFSKIFETGLLKKGLETLLYKIELFYS